jgi:hypothetical protein
MAAAAIDSDSADSRWRAAGVGRSMQRYEAGALACL